MYHYTDTVDSYPKVPSLPPVVAGLSSSHSQFQADKQVSEGARERGEMQGRCRYYMYCRYQIPDTRYQNATYRGNGVSCVTVYGTYSLDDFHVQTRNNCFYCDRLYFLNEASPLPDYSIHLFNYSIYRKNQETKNKISSKMSFSDTKLPYHRTPSLYTSERQ